MSGKHFSLAYRRERRRGERGSIVVIALVLLMLLTIIGISISTTSTIEIQTAANERTFRQNFYQAETAAMQAVTQLETLPAATLKANNGGKIKGETFLHDNSPSTNFETHANWQQIAGTENYYLQINLGPEDMDMTAPTRVYVYSVYGKYRENNADRAIIQVGYKRRY